MHVLEMIPDLGGGGAERIVVTLARELVQREHRVTVVVLRRTPGDTEHVATLETLGVPFIGLDKSGSRSVIAMRTANSVLQSLGADVLHTHRYALHYALPTVLGGMPTVHTVHNVAAAEFPDRLMTGWLGVAAALCRGMTPVCLSQPVADTYRRRYPMLARNTVVIPNGVELRPLANSQGFQDCQEEPFKIAAAGRLVKQKNFALLVEAVALLPNPVLQHLRVDIFGEGEQRRSLEEQIAQFSLGEVIKLHGYVSDVAARLSTYDLFVMTSRFEGLPLVLLEAGAAGVAALVPSLPELKDLVSTARLATFPSGDPQSLAEELLRMCTDRPGLRETARHFRTVVESDFAAAVMAERYEAAFSRALLT